MSHAYQLLKGMEDEASLDGAFAIALDNEKYHDVTLKGNDGVTVAANRIVLSLRSKYFENMFMGSFKENASPTIEADYPGEVVKAVVEYIHTDMAALLVDRLEDNDGQIVQMSEAQTKEFQTLVTLTEAAAYYNLPKLCKKVHNCMKLYLEKFPSLSITVLEVTSQEGPVIPDDLLKTSLTKISSNNFDMLKDDVLGSLSSSALLLIFGNGVCAQQRFEMIRKWASNNPDRQSTAQDMIQNHVELQWIDPDVLSSDVEPTGLVTSYQLLEAFRHQAKRAKHEHNLSFREPFAELKWTHAKSEILTSRDGEYNTDSLNISPLVLGKTYRWTTRVESKRGLRSTEVWLGVVKSTTTLNLYQFGRHQENCWGIYYGIDGCTYEYSCGLCGPPLGPGAKFGDVSIVTLTLDLADQEPNNGSLSISVDDGATILAISNMRDHVDGSNSFLPAVSCYEASATIERFEIL